MHICSKVTWHFVLGDRKKWFLTTLESMYMILISCFLVNPIVLCIQCYYLLYVYRMFGEIKKNNIIFQLVG